MGLARRQRWVGGLWYPGSRQMAGEVLLATTTPAAVTSPCLVGRETRFLPCIFLLYLPRECGSSSRFLQQACRCVLHVCQLSGTGIMLGLSPQSPVAYVTKQEQHQDTSDALASPKVANLWFPFLPFLVSITWQKTKLGTHTVACTGFVLL